MYGIALEGGGARGAYHVGAMKAVIEQGFEIGAIVGTSIGSFNAAVLAQGDYDKLYELWYKGSSKIVIDIKDKELKKVIDRKVDINSVVYWSKYVIAGLGNKGIDVSKLRKLYDKYIDEDRLRASKIDYGTVTYSLTDKKPVYVYKSEIPKGQVVDYILASSYFPVFKQEEFPDHKYYIDGGVYDNCPVQLLLNKGYNNIIEIRTEAVGISRKIDKSKINSYVIRPSKDLGNILFSDNALMKKNIKMGYFDAIRTFNGYLGKKFYVIPVSDTKVFEKLSSISFEQISSMISLQKKTDEINTYEPRKLLFEEILPQITLKLRSKEYDTTSYQKLIVSVIEYLFGEKDMEIYKLYAFEQILEIAKSKARPLISIEQKKVIKNNINILMLKFLISI